VHLDCTCSQLGHTCTCCFTSNNTNKMQQHL